MALQTTTGAPMPDQKTIDAEEAEKIIWLEERAGSLLLFSDEPQAALPKRSAIKILRYKSKEEEGTRETLEFDPLTIEVLYIHKSIQQSQEQRN